jgi:hypothetical protein
LKKIFQLILLVTLAVSCNTNSKKEISLSADLQEKMGDSSLDTSGLSLALEFGKVNFGASTINDMNCNVYQLELESKNKVFAIENCDSTATILEINKL